MLEYNSVKSMSCEALAEKLSELRLQAWQDLNAVDDPEARFINDREKMHRCIEFLGKLISQLKIYAPCTVYEFIGVTEEEEEDKDFPKKARIFIKDIHRWMNYAYS